MRERGTWHSPVTRGAPLVRSRNCPDPEWPPSATAPLCLEAAAGHAPETPMPAARALPLLLASLAFAPGAVAAQAATPAVPAQQAVDAPVRAAVAEFVNALNSFDAERLGRTMGDDVTVFFPG